MLTYAVDIYQVKYTYIFKYKMRILVALRTEVNGDFNIQVTKFFKMLFSIKNQKFMML